MFRLSSGSAALRPSHRSSPKGPVCQQGRSSDTSSAHNGTDLKDSVQLVHFARSSIVYGALRLRCVNLQCPAEFQKLEELLQSPRKLT